MSEQTSKSVSIKFNPQLLNSFPNQNDKTIDYVIVYEKPEDDKDDHIQRRKIVQEAFFDKLKSQGFDVYEIEHKHYEKSMTFVLLNCSMDRLLEEAELSRVELIIKNVNIYSL